MRYCNILICLLLFGWTAPALSFEYTKGEREVATFGMGCFWCAQQAMDNVPGVLKTLVGYSGGSKQEAIYSLVSSGKTEHIESIQVLYDPKVITYSQLLKFFWMNVDPLAKNQQFCDVGNQYNAVIFYHDNLQQDEAKRSFLKVKAIVGENNVLMRKFDNFYKAEKYHQNYYNKNRSYKASQTYIEV